MTAFRLPSENIDELKRLLVLAAPKPCCVCTASLAVHTPECIWDKISYQLYLLENNISLLESFLAKIE